jgi:hypothetical protein
MEEAQLPSKETYPFIFPPQSLPRSIQKFPAEGELYLPVHRCLQFLTLALSLWTLHACFKVAGEIKIFLLISFIREPSVNERCSRDRGHSEGI